MPNPKIEPGNFYHVYNRGINSCPIFTTPENYYYFLKLYNKYIGCIAHTYAWVLMPNHFHFLIYIKEEQHLIDQTGLSTSYPSNLSGFDLDKTKPPHQYFSNLFNAYTKAFNRFNNRHGALFERAFKRKVIDTDEYLKQAVVYIHNNPVKHSFVSHPGDYPWSSYLTCLSSKTSNLKREDVIRLFDGKSSFIESHH